MGKAKVVTFRASVVERARDGQIVMALIDVEKMRAVVTRCSTDAARNLSENIAVCLNGDKPPQREMT